MSARQRKTRRPALNSAKTPNWLHLKQLRPIDDGQVVDGEFVVHCAVPDDLTETPLCCLAPDHKRNGNRMIRVRHRRMQPMPTWLVVKKQRFSCRTCGAVVYEKIGDIHGTRMMTNAFEHEVFMSAIKRPFEDAATFHQLTKATTQRVFLERGRERMKDYEISIPRVLGVDENRILGGDRFIAMDIEKGTILDILESRDTKSLMAYFKVMADCWKPEVFVQDMWRGYETVAKAHFPKATIVIDKFHVVRYANDAFESARKAIQRTLTNEDRIWLKGKRKLLLTRWDQSGEATQDRLAEVLQRYPALEAAYVQKEKFFDLYDLSDRKTAEAAFTDWDERMPKDLARFFRPVSRTVRNWHEPIFNYYEARYTNGVVERMNRSLNEINSRGFGYNFETFRLKALLRFGNIIPLGDLVAFDLGMADEDETTRILNIARVHGFDPATVEAALKDGSF